MNYSQLQLKFAVKALKEGYQVVWLQQPGHYSGFAIKPKDETELQKLRDSSDYLQTPDFLVTPEGYVRPQFIDQPNNMELKKLQEWLTINGVYASGDVLTVPAEGVEHFMITTAR